MSAYTHDVIIIGGGAGGLTSAVGCAQLGMKTALIDKERLGGDCLYYGCVPSKTLLKTASVYHQMQHAAKFGLPEVSQGPVDMSLVNARIAEVIAGIEVHDSPERFMKLGAEVLFGHAEFVSPHEVSLNGDTVLSAPKIILSTGSSPQTIPVPGLAEAGYITNLDAFSLSRLPDRIVTIGAGPIGIELSQAFARLGAKVTVVDVASQILPREDEDMASVISERLEPDGMKFRLGVKVLRVEKNGSGKTIVIGTDSGEETLEADEILLAVGRRGNTEDLGLDKAGVAVEKSFVVTNSKLQTSQKHILGVGDVNGRFLFTHVAGTEGAVAVRRIALHAGGSMNYQTVPWVTYTDPELASVGYNEQRAREAGLDYHVITESYDSNDRARAEGEATGRIKMVLDSKDRVIGTQIAGYHAGDVITPSLYAVASSWKVKDLAGPVFPYPTLGELNKKVISGYRAPMLFNDRMRGILRFLFRYRGDGGEGYQ